MDLKPSKSDARVNKKQAAREDVDLQLYIRFHDVFSRTMEAVRKSLDAIDEIRWGLDRDIQSGAGVPEDKEIAQGLVPGAARSGVYGICDLIFNAKLNEYLAILNTGAIARYDWAGNTLPSPKAPTKTFTRFIYCQPTSHYICWTPGKSGYLLAKDDFTIVIDSVALAPIGNIMFGGRKAEESFEFFVLSGVTLNRYAYQPTSNVITLQDAMTMSDVEADGHVIEQACFDYPPDERKQWMYVTFGGHCTTLDVSGRVLGTKRNLHPAKITAIIAIGGSDYVVTGDANGLLKLWGQRWAFLGEVKAHSAPITHIIEHPNRGASISFGKDQKLFVYGFDSLAEVETIDLPERIDRVAVNKGMNRFLTQGARKLTMWKMNTLFEFRQHLSSPVSKICLSNNTEMIPRAAVTTQDNSIHIVNPGTGLIISTCLLPHLAPPLRSFVYHRQSPSDKIFALVEAEGITQIEQYDFRVNPATLTATWEETKWNVGITYIVLFEHNSKVVLAEKSMAFANRRKAKTAPTSFIICGRRDGCLGILNIDTGDMEQVVSCHKSAVNYIQVDHELNQAISLGTSPSLRLWKIGSTMEDILVPLMDITWKQPFRLATMVRNVIAFALDHGDEHNIAVFNTTLAQRFDHDPKVAHTAEIVSISACRELVIFCTASKDGTIIIRGDRNEHYRTINLHNIPSYAAFVTPQPDILLGMGKDLYIMPANLYLSYVPRYRVINTDIKPNQVEEPIPFTGKILRDPRVLNYNEGLTYTPTPIVIESAFESDSQQAREIDFIRLVNEDLEKIISGNHPLEEIVPDFRNMTKQQWDDFGRSVYGDDGGDHKFFVSDSRMEAMLAMKRSAKDLDNFDNID